MLRVTNSVMRVAKTEELRQKHTCDVVPSPGPAPGAARAHIRLFNEAITETGIWGISNLLARWQEKVGGDTLQECVIISAVSVDISSVCTAASRLGCGTCLTSWKVSPKLSVLCWTSQTFVIYLLENATLAQAGDSSAKICDTKTINSLVICKFTSRFEAAKHCQVRDRSDCRLFAKRSCAALLLSGRLRCTILRCQRLFAEHWNHIAFPSLSDRLKD